MKIGQLREVLKTAEGHYRRDGRNDVADALSAFVANLLKGDSSQTVTGFVAHIEKLRKPAAGRRSRGNGRKRGAVGAKR